jgi:hypothetical protein
VCGRDREREIIVTDGNSLNWGKNGWPGKKMNQIDQNRWQLPFEHILAITDPRFWSLVRLFLNKANDTTVNFRSLSWKCKIWPHQRKLIWLRVAICYFNKENRGITSPLPSDIFRQNIKVFCSKGK